MSLKQIIKNKIKTYINKIDNEIDINDYDSIIKTLKQYVIPNK